MITNGSIPTSWREASRYASTPISTLRAAVRRGEVPTPTVGPDGATVWDVAALDRLRAARGAPVIAPAIATSTSSTPAMIAPEAPLGPIPSFLLRAVENRDEAAENEREDASDADQTAHEPPFWEALPPPSYPEGEPYVEASTGRICYRPVPAPPGPHAPGTPAAVVPQLQAQVVELQTQLAAVRAAWRGARIAEIGAEVAVEALLGSVLPQVVPAVRDAAHAAAAALTDDELRREDGYPQAVARGAGMAAAQQLGAAIAWQAQQPPWPPPRDPSDEVARARARRRRDRRW